jgi:biopolymer transport protein ExbD
MNVRRLVFAIVVLAAACQPAAQQTEPVAAGPAPREIHVGISDTGVITLDGEVVAESELDARFKAIAVQEPQPAVLLHPDRKTTYGAFAKVMAAIERAGVASSGVVGGT